MAITSALVLLAVIWFATLFVVLPLNLKTQAESGEVVPGTPASAPDDPQMKRKAKIITMIAFPIWLILVAVILSGILPLSSLDMYIHVNATPRFDETGG